MVWGAPVSEQVLRVFRLDAKCCQLCPEPLAYRVYPEAASVLGRFQVLLKSLSTRDKPGLCRRTLRISCSHHRRHSRFLLESPISNLQCSGISSCYSTGIGIDTVTDTVYAAFVPTSFVTLATTISVIDKTNSVIDTVSYQGGIAGGSIPGLAVNSQTHMTYATGESSLTVINGVTPSAAYYVTSIPLHTPNCPPGNPSCTGGAYNVMVDGSRDRVYVALVFDDSVAVIDGASNSVLTYVLVGATGYLNQPNGPMGLAVDPTRCQVYVAIRYGHSVVVIRPSG